MFLILGLEELPSVLRLRIHLLRCVACSHTGRRLRLLLRLRLVLLLLVEVALRQFLLHLLLGEDLASDLALCVQLHLQLLQILDVLVGCIVLRAVSVLRGSGETESAIACDVVIKPYVL